MKSKNFAALLKFIELHKIHMKKCNISARSVVALGLVVIMICPFLAGCSNRSTDENKNPPEEQDVPKEDSPAEDSKNNNDVEPNSSEDKNPIDSESEEGKSNPTDKESPPEDSTSGDAAISEGENASLGNAAVIDEPLGEISRQYSDGTSGAISAAGVDLSGFASLDNVKCGWGPGGPVDENNRSLGAISCQEKYSKYDADFIAENVEKIYLTFDEGYENGYTAKILDVLKEKKVPAVFFVTMPYVKSNPELIRRMIDEGHQVGNHSVNHPCFPETPLSECQTEIIELHNYIQENFNYTMNLFRFPMGEYNEQTLALVQKLGYRSVFWSFAYRDWLVDEQPDPTQATETILKKVHPGEIMLLHAVSKTNTEILPNVIDSITAKGLVFAPYPE